MHRSRFRLSRPSGTGAPGGASASSGWSVGRPAVVVAGFATMVVAFQRRRPRPPQVDRSARGARASSRGRRAPALQARNHAATPAADGAHGDDSSVACASSGRPSWSPACWRCSSSRSSIRPICAGSAVRAIAGPPVAIYSVTFLMFWGAIATAGALTALLSLTAEELNLRAATRPPSR
jgi:hypothetical protein